jgi:phosphonate transport system ATP-binding protein
MADVVMSDFRRINEEMNITILLNIHHVDLALKYATRVIGVRAGEIVYDGPSSQVTKDVLNQVYNGQTVPTTENDTKPGKADNTDSAGKKELRA